MLFVDIETLVLILFNPVFGIHSRYISRHQAGENSVSGILRGSREDGGVEVLVDIEKFRHEGLDLLPLVKAEIVYQEEAYLVAVVKQRKYTAPEYLMAHQRMVVAGDPVLVITLDELAEIGIGVALLHQQHFLHRRVVGFGQFQFPPHQLAIYLHPFLHCGGAVDVAGNMLELLTIVARSLFGDYFPAVQIFLDGKKYLVGIHRFYQIIGNPVAYGLVHDVLLFRLCDHDHRNLGVSLIDEVKSLET